jgi:hypothetical protein
MRPGEHEAVPTGDDRDGDGIAGAEDHGPDALNPVRPVDIPPSGPGARAAHDGDGLGDVCDPRPLQAGVTGSQARDPGELDGNGVHSGLAHCLFTANAGQSGQESDRQGDACGPCPDPPGPHVDGAGKCPRVDDSHRNGYVASYPMGTEETTVRGIPCYGHSNRKLLPRRAEDLVAQ